MRLFSVSREIVSSAHVNHPSRIRDLSWKADTMFKIGSPVILGILSPP